MIDIFTKQEKLSIVLILFGVIIGAGIELYKSQRKPIANETDIKRLDEIETQFRQQAAAIDSFVAQEQSLMLLHSVNQRSTQDSSLPIVDINSATVDELIKLPKIGPVIAERIVAYREHHGPFQNIEELIRVRGIGPKKLSALKPYIQTRIK
ncbi:MAG TPA: helix-hairpin-helix domain-containing protein [bacterium]